MKGDNIMKTFTMNELENAFEIGRIVQHMLHENKIEILDSKNAFLYALELAMEFEETYPDTEEYYTDIEMFVVEKLQAKFGFEN